MSESSRAAREPESRKSRPAKKNRAWVAVREVGIIVVAALLLSSVLKAFVFQAFLIPSASMQDTLNSGDRVLVSKITPRFGEIERGDIVVFQDPGGWLQLPEADTSQGAMSWVRAGLSFVGVLPADGEGYLIKRVIGLPGDEIQCIEGEQHLRVNGVEVVESYVREQDATCGMPFHISVADNGYWMMGDNRNHSKDSRYYLGNPGGGSVKEDYIVGKAKWILWPVSHWTSLEHELDTFADVD